MRPAPTPVPTATPTPAPSPTPNIPEAALVGLWEGAIHLLGNVVPVSVAFQIEDGELRGTLDVSSRQIKSLPITAELAPDGTYRFTIPQPESDIVFSGTLSGNVVAGTFRHGIFWGSYSLERVTPRD